MLWRQRGPILGAILGAVVALSGFGCDHVLGNSSFWDYPPTDFSSNIIGYRMFIQDAWRFPVFDTATLEPPTGVNLLYMDSLPIVALVAKAIRAILPGFLHTLWFNPFGAWQILSYALQGMFGALLVRQLGERSFVAQASGAAVVCSMSMFILRFVHTALGSHFFLLAALLLYLRTREGTSVRRAIASWSTLLVLAVLVHPYLFVMSGGLFVAALITSARHGVRRAVPIAVVPTVVTTATVLVAGFVGRRSIQGGDWGFGHKSTDLISFVVPQYSTFLSARPGRFALDMAHAEAAEGWDYLGLGVLALALVLLVAAPRVILRSINKHAALTIVLLLMAAFAVSNRLTIAGHTVLEVRVPEVFGWIVRQLRSSGRFIWPATYAGVIYLVALGFRTFRSGWSRCVTPLLVLVQFTDGMGNFTFVRDYTSRGETRYLEWDSWRDFVRSHRALTIAPAIGCIDWRRAIVDFSSAELHYIAAGRGISVSSVHGSRSLRDCAREPSDRVHAPIERDHLYVMFVDTPAAEQIRYERAGLGCVTFGLGYACSSQLTDVPKGFARMPPTASYAVDTPIAFGKEGRDVEYIGEGWSYAEPGHRWTVGPASFLYLRLGAPLAPRARLQFVATSRAGADVYVNGAHAGTLDLKGEAVRLNLDLPAVAAGQQLLEIEIRPVESRPPAILGPSTETRALGVDMSELAIVK